jgi:hypothetical protein
MFDLLVGTVVVDERLALPAPPPPLPPFHQEQLFEISDPVGAGTEPS